MIRTLTKCDLRDFGRGNGFDETAQVRLVFWGKTQKTYAVSEAGLKSVRNRMFLNEIAVEHSKVFMGIASLCSNVSSFRAVRSE